MPLRMKQIKWAQSTGFGSGWNGSVDGVRLFGIHYDASTPAGKRGPDFKPYLLGHEIPGFKGHREPLRFATVEEAQARAQKIGDAIIARYGQEA